MVKFKMTVSIVIPVYNERHLISQLLEEVLQSDTSPFEKEIIIVDDGSTDGTGELLKNYVETYPVKTIIHPENLGKARAIKSALKIADGDIILIQDGDLEYPPSEYKKLLLPFRDTATRVVYGSRFLYKRWPERMKPENWIANKLFTCLVNLLYNADITDEGTAFKVFRKEVFQEIEIKSSGFEFCPEVTAKVLKMGIRIKEVPVRYTARNRKEGKKPNIRDGIMILWSIIKYRFRD